MVNSGTTAGQHGTPQNTSTYERPFTHEGNYLVFTLGVMFVLFILFMSITTTPFALQVSHLTEMYVNVMFMHMNDESL